MDSLDLRKPTGVLFVLLGALLTAYGISGVSIPPEAGPDLNLNLIWGCIMLFGGLCFLALARRKRIISSQGPDLGHQPR
jgi:drug/metabolite transporter (DMT)-like permease